MDKLMPKNIRSSQQFKEKLKGVMGGVYELLECAREYDLKPVDENGVTRYAEDVGKCSFQVSGQYERPAEFLQTLLDIVRADFEPSPLGTFFLNSNMEFIYDAIPDRPFQLAYASLVSEDGQSFVSFFQDAVQPHLKRCGYNASQFSAMFVVASTGRERYGVKFTAEISRALGSGFSTNEAMGLLAAELDAPASEPLKETYAGYCLVPELESRIRLSLWCFVTAPRAELH